MFDRHCSYNMNNPRGNMNKLELIRYFTTVYEVESFTLAANILNVPKASVSAAIQKLEALLGTRLLQRTTRKVTPTHDGQLFFERSRDILADMNELEGMFQKSGASLSGRVRVDFPTTIARSVIIPKLPSFLEKYPEIEIELGSTSRKVDVIREGYDFVLRVGSLADSGLIAKKVGEYKISNCASPAYVKKYGTPKKIDDLKKHLIINYAPTFGSKPEGFEYFDGEKYAQIKMKSVITVNDIDSYQHSCYAGLGIIQVPTAGVRKELSKGALMEVLDRCKAEPMPISIIYPHRRNMPKRVKVFMDWVEEVIQSYII